MLPNQVVKCCNSNKQGPNWGVNLDDSAKIDRVDRWLEDVSAASRRWKIAKAAQQASEKNVSYLVQIRDGVSCVPSDLKARMEEAIAANVRNAERLAEEALRQSRLESGFYAVLGQVSPPEVAEAWRMRCIDGKTWLQCSLALHYNRQHLERLSKRAKVAAYPLIPGEYR